MKKKILALSLALGVFALILSAGTLAYFTDRTDPVVNTFTVGKVDISLTEAEEGEWGLENGIPKTALMPGGKYSKTPVIKVEDGSQDAYVYALIKLSNAKDYVRAVANMFTNGNMTASDALVARYESGEFDNALSGAMTGMITGEDGFLSGFSTNDWDIVNFKIDNASDTASIVVAHKGLMSAGDKATLFTSINVPTSFTNETFAKTDFSNATITITAAAIQAQGFEATTDSEGNPVPAYINAGNALAEQWGISF